MLGTLQQAAAGDGLRRVHRILANVDVLDDTLFVDNEGRALSQFVARSTDLFLANRDPKLLEDFEVRIAQERKRDIELLREGGIRRRAVTAYAENYCVARIQLWPISLIGFEFVASSLCKGQHVEDEHDILLPSEVAELDLFPVIAQQCEIWGLVSRPQDSRGRGLSQSGRREGKGREGHRPGEHSKSFH